MVDSPVHAPALQRKKKLQRPYRHTDEASTEAPGSSTGRHHDVLSLQRLAGNRAAAHLAARAPDPAAAVQRLPDSAAMVQDAGAPKKKSTQYRALLDSLDRYNQYIKTKPIGATPKSVNTNIDAGLAHLDTVRTSFLPLKAKIELKGVGRRSSTKRKRAAILAVETKIQEERAKLIGLQAQFGAGKSFLSGIPTIHQAFTSDYQSGPVKLKTANRVGQNRGGSSEVTEYNQGGQRGYFKAQKSEFAFKNDDDFYEAEEAFNKDKKALLIERRRCQDDVDQLTEEINALTSQTDEAVDDQVLEQMQSELSDGKQRIDELNSEIETLRLEFNAKQNELYLANQLGGIDPNDARMSNRDVAMSMIDKLLGADVIAPAQFAMQEDPSVPNGIPGSFMEKAQGVQLGTMIKQNQFRPDDANLMRQLSRLQLIDLLCFQIDRNLSNIFIVTDQQGRVTKVTGIDNDFSLGTSTGFEERAQELPGISRYVDQDLATRILELKPNILGDLVVGLLSTAEIDALKQRLIKLQQYLARIKAVGGFLKPDQWTVAVKEKLFEEEKSYLQNAQYQVTKTI